MDKIKTILIIAVVIFGIGAFIYGVVSLKKTVSYNMYYKDNVEQTVRDMVKPEYLK